MYYINKFPNENGNHGNPKTNQIDNMVVLPNELLSSYISAKGFVHIQVEDGYVTSMDVNQQCLSLYETTHTELNDVEKPLSTNLLKNQIQVLTDQQSFLEDCIAEMAQIVYE